MPKKTAAAATTDRQWQVLAQLDRKRWIGTHDIRNKLRLAGFEVSLRTIQRDLNSLARRFPIEKNDASPQGWRWQADAPMQSLPQMNLPQALAFRMVEANLSQLLPPTVLDELIPWFDLAQRQLGEHSRGTTWLDSVRILPATQPLIAPSIDKKAQIHIYDGLFEKKQILAQYQRRQHDNPTEYRLNPIAIVQRGYVIYLVATRVDDPKHTKRLFALHRFSQAKMLDQDAVIPDDFDLDDFISSGKLGFTHPKLQDQLATITLVFTPSAGASLLESRLSEDQHIELTEDSLTVTATVNLTSQLVWWLRGFGKGLKQIHPKQLSRAVTESQTDVE